MLKQYADVAGVMEELNLHIPPDQIQDLGTFRPGGDYRAFSRLRKLSLPYQEPSPFSGAYFPAPGTALPSTLQEMNIHYPLAETVAWMEELAAKKDSLPELKTLNIFTHYQVLGGSADFLADFPDQDSSLASRLLEAGVTVNLHQTLNPASD